MITRTITTLLFLAVLVTPWTSRAQFIEDALRLAPASDAMNARSSAMGNAFIGVADDASALFWNPAGLGQIRQSDFSLGLTYLSAGNESTFLSASLDADKSSTHLNQLSLAVPFPVMRGSLVFAAGYQRLSNFTGMMAVDAFNTQSSIQPSLYDTDERYDLAWQLGLEDTSALSYQNEQNKGWLGIPVNRNVQQMAEVLESGGLHQWSFGGSMEVAPNLLLGLSMNFLTGSYDYERTFTEEDSRNQHSGSIYGVEGKLRTDFQSMSVTDVIRQDLSGWNLKLGFLYNLKDKLRFGLSIQTPSLMTVDEEYYRKGKAYFANVTEQWSLDRSNQIYDINTPWVFGVGVAGHPLPYATISADVEFIDYTQLEFDVPLDSPLHDRNKDIRDSRSGLRSVTNFRVGAEFTIPETDLSLRAGYGYMMTPYQAFKNFSDFNATSFSGGIGYLIDNAFMINAAVVMTQYSTERVLYTDPDIRVPEEAFTTSEKINAMRIVLSTSYRF